MEFFESNVTCIFCHITKGVIRMLIDYDPTPGYLDPDSRLPVTPITGGTQLHAYAPSIFCLSSKKWGTALWGDGLIQSGSIDGIGRISHIIGASATFCQSCGEKVEIFLGVVEREKEKCFQTRARGRPTTAPDCAILRNTPTLFSLSDGYFAIRVITSILRIFHLRG